MPYRVRTPDGELTFPDLTDIAQAYAAGLVGPEDEVQEVGASTWRKAGTLPVLAGAQSHARATGRAQARSILVVAVLGVLSLYLMFFQESRMPRTLGFLLALVLSFQGTRIVTRAWSRRS